MRHTHHARALFRGAVTVIHLLQLPLFLGLLLALVMFGVSFFYAIVEAVLTLEFLDRSEAILLVLDLLDMVFIANLIVMVTVSGYNTYFAESTVDPEQRQELARRDTFAPVKARIAATLVIISGIHLVHEVLEDDIGDPLDLLLLTVVHLVLLATAAALVYLARQEH